MTALLLILRRVPMWAWIALALLAAGLFYGHPRYNAGQADVQGAFDAHLAADKTATEAFNAVSKAKDAQQAEALAQVGFRYEREKADALDKQAAVIAGLRSGAARLSKRWACPATHLPNPAGSAGEPDAYERDRQESAGRIIGYAAQCDAQVAGLQAVIRAERQ